MAVDKKISYEQARKKLNEAAPKGHQLAFITPAEANLLKSKGASGEMTKAGIRSYRGHHGGPSGTSSGSSSSSGGDPGGNKGGLKGLRSSGMVSTSTAPNAPAGAGGLAAPEGPGPQGKDDSGPETDASLLGFVDKRGNPVVSKRTGEQIGFSQSFYSKDTPFANAALEAALANPASPGFNAASRAIGQDPERAEKLGINLNNLGLGPQEPQSPTPTVDPIRQRIEALKRQRLSFQSPFTPTLTSIPTVNPTFAPNFAPTRAFIEATRDEDDDGLSLGEAIAQDFANFGQAVANIPSAVYGAVTNPVGTLERSVQSPLGQYAQLSMPNIGPTAIGLSMLNFRPSFNEQGETIGTGFLGPKGVSTHGAYQTDNYGLDDESDRVDFERSFYNALYSPADNVKGYTVDADAAQAVADQYGATYSGPDMGAMAQEAQEGTRGGPETEAVIASAKPPTTLDTITGDSGLPQQTPEQIQQNLTALYNSMTEQQRSTIDKITQLPEYDLGFGIRYILEGGPLF